MLRILDKFTKFSGLKMNAEKCAVLRIGPWKDSEAWFYTLKQLYWGPDPIKILGFQIYPKRDLMDKENFEDLLYKAEKIMKSWIKRNLTIIGKITVVNTLINSLFIHKLTVLPTPEDIFFQRYRRIVSNFLWNGRVAKISYDKLVQDYHGLGLKMVDLKAKER